MRLSKLPNRLTKNDTNPLLKGSLWVFFLLLGFIGQLSAGLFDEDPKYDPERNCHGYASGIARETELHVDFSDKARVYRAWLFHPHWELPPQTLNFTLELVGEQTSKKEYSIEGKGEGKMLLISELDVGFKQFFDDLSRNEPLQKTTLVVRSTSGSAIAEFSNWFDNAFGSARLCERLARYEDIRLKRIENADQNPFD